MSDTFDDVRLPEDIEQGASIGPQFQTTIVPLSSGGEQRNADWQQERIVADISYGIMDRDDPRDVANSFAAVMRFYRARMGRWRGFRFRDWSDYQAINVPMEMITPFFARLYIDYDSHYRRYISRPVLDSIQMPGVQGSWTILQGGIVRFQLNQGMATKHISFDFDIPVRFDADLAQVNLTLVDVADIPNIKLMQISDAPDPAVLQSLAEASGNA